MALALSKSEEFEKPITALARKRGAVNNCVAEDVQETGAPALEVMMQEIPVRSRFSA
jgi:hypothetical protein